jgi:hypothetical protein
LSLLYHFRVFRPLAALGLLLLVWLSPSSCRAATDFRIQPERVVLEGNYAQAQLLVAACDAQGRLSERSGDLTQQAVYVSSDPTVVTVSRTGRLLAIGDGEAVVSVQAAGTAHHVPVKVSGVLPSPRISFADQVLPVISKAGCNAGACHASQYGKGGFKLSVFAYAPEEDHYAIVRYGFGRRVNLNDPRRSLFLMKPTLGVPHEGGHRLQAGSTDYQILYQWLACGAPGPDSKAAAVTGIQVSPKRRVGHEGFAQQLRVVAMYSNGTTRDVTAWAKFDSMDEGVLQVSREGLVRTVGRGQGVAMVRFGGQADVATVVVPYADAVDLAGWKDNNWIDTLAAAKFKEIGIAPSPLCDDATFLRRAYLDAIGTLPTVEQATTFLDSKDPAKRKKLIDELLGLTGDPGRNIHDSEYAAYWTLKWSDLIRSNSASIGEQGMWALYNWIKESFRENKPFDHFVRELVTAKGSTYCNGPANYFRIAGSPQDRAEETSQLFLGVRLQCAKCHHHPYESFSQDDYYGFAAFFARVGNKGSQEFGIFGGETVILVSSAGEVRNPRTGKILAPTPLNGKAIAASLDRRDALAAWLTSPQNPYFARSIVNRYMAYLLGRGLVEPIDDMRATNAPTNPALLDALAADFATSGFNLKHLLRTIMNSRLYQLDSEPTKNNVTDDRFYSHYSVKRPPAEPLLDAIDRATGVPTKFNKVPLGTRAIELPDAQYNNYFLTAFGKPRREAVCECERVSEPNLSQALHTLNSDVLAAKISNPKGRVAKLLAAKKSPAEIIDELYLATLCRRPHAEERSTCEKMLASNPDKKAFYEDLLWSLINTKYFLFVH